VRELFAKKEAKKPADTTADTAKQTENTVYFGMTNNNTPAQKIKNGSVNFSTHMLHHTGKY